MSFSLLWNRGIAPWSWWTPICQHSTNSWRLQVHFVVRVWCTFLGFLSLNLRSLVGDRPISFLHKALEMPKVGSQKWVCMCICESESVIGLGFVVYEYFGCEFVWIVALDFLKWRDLWILHGCKGPLMTSNLCLFPLFNRVRMASISVGPLIWRYCPSPLIVLHFCQCLPWCRWKWKLIQHLSVALVISAACLGVKAGGSVWEI